MLISILLESYMPDFFSLNYVLTITLISLIYLIAYWKIYEKAGKPGWASLIPFYNLIVLFEIIGKPWWWLLLMLIPGINIIFAVWTYNLVSKSFGHSEGFTIGLILLGFIFIPILAFGDSKYIGPAGS